MANEQRQAFVLACTAARRRLYLCHPTADAEGREALPSYQELSFGSTGRERTDPASRAEFEDRIGVLPSSVRRPGAAEWDDFLAGADQEIAARHRSMSEGEIRIRPADGDCRYCDLKGLCRIDLWRARRETVGGCD